MRTYIKGAMYMISLLFMTLLVGCVQTHKAERDIVRAFCKAISAQDRDAIIELFEPDARDHELILAFVDHLAVENEMKWSLDETGISADADESSSTVIARINTQVKTGEGTAEDKIEVYFYLVNIEDKWYISGIDW